MAAAVSSLVFSREFNYLNHFLLFFLSFKKIFILLFISKMLKSRDSSYINFGHGWDILHNLRYPTPAVSVVGNCLFVSATSILT